MARKAPRQRLRAGHKAAAVRVYRREGLNRRQIGARIRRLGWVYSRAYKVHSWRVSPSSVLMEALIALPALRIMDYRTYEEQRALVDAWKASHGELFAQPGALSHHAHGPAIDTEDCPNDHH